MLDDSNPRSPLVARPPLPPYLLKGGEGGQGTVNYCVGQMTTPGSVAMNFGMS